MNNTPEQQRPEETASVRYGTIFAWATEFGVSHGVVARRLEHLRGATGKDARGKVLDEAFYPEETVRELCKDLLTNVPQADEDGFLTQDGERYSTKMRWGDVLGISATTITTRLGAEKGILAKTRNGYRFPFYPESLIRRLCQDLIQEMPQADESGFFTQDGQRYAPIHKWAERLGISRKGIISRLGQRQGITAKDTRGHIANSSYYPESLIREVCADLLSGLPEADATGFFVKDGERFGTISRWAKELGMSDAKLKNFLSGCEGVAGMIPSGVVWPFFAESAVRSACEHVSSLPQADADGYIIREDGRWATRDIWCVVFGLNDPMMCKRLKGRPTIRGKSRGRKKIVDFYREEDVRAAVADLIEQMPQASTDGIVIIEGMRHASQTRWADILGIPLPTLNMRLRGLKGITAKDHTDRFWKEHFLSESIVRERCADLLPPVA